MNQPEKPKKKRVYKFKAGKPLYYSEDEEGLKRFNEKINEYFTTLELYDENPTINGAALFLGFNDKTSLYDYQKKPIFTGSVRKIRAIIEQFHENRMTCNNVAGSIFTLKNFGWKDTQEQVVINKDYKIDLSDLDEEEDED